MTKYRVTYEIDAMNNYDVESNDQGGYIHVKPGVVHSYPKDAIVEEVVPEFKPGWYRNKSMGDRPYWLQRATSNTAMDGDVYYYTLLKPTDHTLIRINTTNWNQDHDSWIRLKFVDEDSDA